MTTREQHYNADKTMAEPEPYQKQFLLLETGIVGYRQIISICPYVCLKGNCSLARREPLNTGE